MAEPRKGLAVQTWAEEEGENWFQGLVLWSLHACLAHVPFPLTHTVFKKSVYKMLCWSLQASDFAFQMNMIKFKVAYFSKCSKWDIFLSHPPRATEWTQCLSQEGEAVPTPLHCLDVTCVCWRTPASSQNVSETLPVRLLPSKALVSEIALPGTAELRVRVV